MSFSAWQKRAAVPSPWEWPQSQTGGRGVGGDRVFSRLEKHTFRWGFCLRSPCSPRLQDPAAMGTCRVVWMEEHGGPGPGSRSQALCAIKRGVPRLRFREGRPFSSP